MNFPASVGTYVDQHLRNKLQKSNVDKREKMCENVDKMWQHNANTIGNVEMWDAGPASVATNIDVVWTSECWSNMFHISVYAYGVGMY
jgi:hypothetical protein